MDQKVKLESAKNMKILVTTPGGQIGRRVLSELLAPEFSVRIIAREPSRLPAEIREEVEIIQGSADDAAVLRQALDGVEAIFWCVPSERWLAAGVEHHYERFARAGCEAIREAGTPRVVTMSAVGKGLARNAGPISDMHSVENILNQSGAAIRHLRCGWLMENLLRQAERIFGRGLFSYPMSGHVALPMVAATDVADVALRWLVKPGWDDIKSVRVHGAGDLSLAQAATILERVLDQPVRYREASAEEYVQDLIRSGASVQFARRQTAMLAELARGISRAEPCTSESTTPTTLAAWTKAELLPLAESLYPSARIETAAVCFGRE